MFFDFCQSFFKKLIKRHFFSCFTVYQFVFTQQIESAGSIFKRKIFVDRQQLFICHHIVKQRIKSGLSITVRFDKFSYI